MWLCQGLYVTSDSEIQHSAPPWHQRQGSVHPTEAEYVVWSNDGIDGAMAGLRLLEATEPEARGPGIGGGGSENNRWRRMEMSRSGTLLLVHSRGIKGIII